jgi:nicotinate-nucleotide pyrophosphorylase (carboxylating)
MSLPAELVRRCVRRALDEDLGTEGDITAAIAVPAGKMAEAVIVSRGAGILAGLPLAGCCFSTLDADSSFGTGGLQDGDRLEPGTEIARVLGDARALLSAERTALNFLQRLSGIATRAARFVEAAGNGVRILDTRKTTPTLRTLEKYAVQVGGGVNHRVGLFDQILLKENHFALAERPYQEVVEAAVASSAVPVVAEARSAQEALSALAGGARVVLLDNFTPGPRLRGCVESLRREASRLGRRVEIEVSGGVTLSTVRAFAECGVDRISVGALTHSAPALDISMLIHSRP